MMAKKNSVLLLLLIVMLSCIVGTFIINWAPVQKASAETTINATLNTEGISTSDNIPVGSSGVSVSPVSSSKLLIAFETVDVSSFDASKAVFEFWLYIPEGGSYSFGKDNTMSIYNRWSTSWGYIEFDDHCTAYDFTVLNVQEGWNKIQIPLGALMGFNSATINQVNGFELWGDDVTGMLMHGVTFTEVASPSISVLEYQKLGAPKSLAVNVTGGTVEDINVPTGETGVSYKTARADYIMAMNFDAVNVYSWDMTKLVIEFWIFVQDGATYVGTGTDGLYTEGGELRFSIHFNQDLATLSFTQGWNKVRIPMPVMADYGQAYSTITGLHLWGYSQDRTDMLVYGVTLKEVDSPTLSIVEQYNAEYKEKYPLGVTITSGVENDNIPEGETGKSYATSRADHIMSVGFETINISDMDKSKAVMQLWIYIAEGETLVASDSDGFITEWGNFGIKGFMNLSFSSLTIQEGWNKVQIPLSVVIDFTTSHPTIPQIKGVLFFGGASSGAPALIYGITFAEVEDTTFKVLDYQAIAAEPEVSCDCCDDTCTGECICVAGSACDTSCTCGSANCNSAPVVPERQATIDLLATDGTLYSGMSLVWGGSAANIVEKAPAASSGKSLQNYTTWGSCFQGTEIDISAFINPAVSVWIYIDDVEDIDNTSANCFFEITLTGGYTYHHIPLDDCISGWNKIILEVDDSITTVTKFNLEVHAKDSTKIANVLIHNAQIIDYEGTETGVVATEVKVVEPDPDPIDDTDIIGVDGVVANSGTYGWNSGASIDVIPTGKDGKSVKTADIGGSGVFVAGLDLNWANGFDISKYNTAQLALDFWMYIPYGTSIDVNAFYQANGLENEVLLQVVFTNLDLVYGWNHVRAPFNSGSATKIKRLSMFVQDVKGDDTMILFYNLKFVQDLSPSIQLVETQELTEAPVIEREDPISVFATDGNLISGASWSWPSYITESSIKDFAPSASSGKSINAYTPWGNNIAFENPIDISEFKNPAISAWIYVEKLDYVDANKLFAFETIDYQYATIDMTNFVRGWNKVILPISGSTVNKIQIHVFGNENYGYKPDYVWYHDIQIVDTLENGVVATEEATTPEPSTPVPVADFVVMNDKVELATGAEFGWGYLDQNNLVPVDIAPVANGMSMRLLTDYAGLRIDFPASLMPDFQIQAAVQFWAYIPDVTAITGAVNASAKDYTTDPVNIASTMVAGWNKIQIPLSAYADDTVKFFIQFITNENYIPASILIHDIRFVDSAKSGVLETKALPESATFVESTLNMTAENYIAEIPEITTAPDNVKLIWNYASGNTDVVRIIDGQLVAVANGTATITASVGSLSATLTVQVTGFKEAATIIVDNDEIYITDGIDEQYIEITVKDADGIEFTQYLVKYSSSNKLVAVVDEEGKIIPLSNGETTVTVTVGNVSETVLVIVEDIEEGIALQNKEGVVQLGGSYGWEGSYAGGGEALIVPFGESGAGRFMNAAGGLDITGFTLDLNGLSRENMAWDFWLFIPESAGAPTDVKIDIMGGKKYYTIPGADFVNGYNHVQIPIDIKDLNKINRFSMFYSPTNEGTIVEIVVYNVKLIAVENPAYGVVEKQLVPTSLTASATDVTVTKTENNVDLPTITFGPEGSMANVVYTSSNKYIADVVNGEIVGYANGTVTVTVALAMDEEVYTTFTVNVSGFPDVTALIVTGGNEFTLVPMERLTLEVKPDKDGANVVLSYKSSNTAVALVSGNGTITAIGEGECTITVKLEGTNISTTINIKVATASEENGDSKGGCGSFVGSASMIAFSALTACAVVFMKKKAK